MGGKARAWFFAEGEILLLLLLALCLKAPALSVPFFWDEILTYAGPARWLSENGLYRVLPGLHPAQLFFGHPPGLSLASALLFKIFGSHPEPARILVLTTSLTQLFFTYRLGVHFRGRATGFAAAAALLALPTFFAHSTQALGDVTAAGFGAAALYYALKNEGKHYALWALLAVLSKETALALVLPVFIWSLLRDRSPASILWYAAPLLALGGFFLSEKIFTGRFTNFPFMETVAFVDEGYFSRLLRYGHAFFFSHANAALATAAGLGALTLLRRRPREVTLLLAVLLCYWGGISVLTLINDRYWLPVLPLLAVLAASLAFDRKWLLAPLLGAWIWSTLSFHHDAQSVPGHGWEESMNYRDVVSVHQEACRYVEEHYPRSKVYAVWPLSDALLFPWLGYVSQKFEVVPAAPYDLVLVSDASAHYGYEAQRTEIKSAGLRLIRRFEKNGKYAEIWAP